jgi:hypothetical protein
MVQGGGLAVDSVISGTGPLIKIGPGSLFLGGVTGGTGNNTYSGGTIVNSGPLYLSKNANGIAAPGNLTIGPSSSPQAVAHWVNSGMMSASATVTVNSLSLLDLNGQGQILTRLNLNDGGKAQTGAGALSFVDGGVVAVDTLNPHPIGLVDSASISGAIDVPEFNTMTFTVAQYGNNPISPTTPELDVPANIFGVGDIHKNGPGRLRFRGNNSFNGPRVETCKCWAARSSPPAPPRWAARAASPLWIPPARSLSTAASPSPVNRFRCSAPTPPDC